MKTTQIDKYYVLRVLNNNGIDEEYLSDNDNMIEGGTEEWMDVLSELCDGIDVYDIDLLNNISKEQLDKIEEFIRIMEEEIGIKLF